LCFLENATEQERLDLVEEIKILKKVNEEPHPNIIRFIGACSIEGGSIQKGIQTDEYTQK
jgi:Ni,Fe-hydrogenase III small subunit